MMDQPEDMKSQIDAALGSIKQRLENIEARNSDPFGDVKNALRSIETYRQQLTSDLGKMYQQNIDQMSQAAKSLGTWHGQIKSEVNQYCEEHHAELLKAGEQMFARLDALEDASIGSTIQRHEQRLDILETASKSYANNKRLDDVAVRGRRLEEFLRKQEQRESAKWEQHKQHIDTLRQNMQDSSVCATNGIDKAQKECRGRYDRLQGIHSNVNNRLPSSKTR